jgi:hypothetical protein
MKSSRPREIRQLVQQQFAVISPTAGPICEETLLIRNGQYCGHRYQSDGLSAVWFLEEDQVKIYHRDGHVLGVFCASDAVRKQRADAA